MPDYELMELALFAAIPRRDVKPLAKALIARFGSFAEAIAAPRERLLEVDGMSEGVVDAAQDRRSRRAEASRRPASWAGPPCLRGRR